MANTLLINKLTGGYYQFVLNGDTANAVRGIKNDLLAVGEQLHFKTGNGANIIKEQFIYPADLTIVASGTFTFSSVDEVWTKLIEIGYFDWINSGGSGTGASRFDDLLDTFKYTGKDGQVVIVNESQQKLQTVQLYNYRTFTDLEDTPDLLLANKMVATNEAGTALIFKNLPEDPVNYLNSIGFFDYNDLATQTTAISVAANTDTKLTNDTLGAYTNISYPPYGVSSLWDATTSRFNFTQLSIGDTIDVRIHLQVTTTSANQSYRIGAKFGIGSASAFDNVIFTDQAKTAGVQEVSFVAPFYIGEANILNNPAELYINTDASATVKVDGWYIRVLRRNINIVTVDTGVPDATTTVKGIVRLAGDLAGTATTPTVPALATKVPNSRTLTINGVAHDLSADRSWTINPSIVWGDITGVLSNQTDLQNALNAKEPSIASGTTAQYWRGDKSWQTLDKTAVGLANVDNTSDANKPISIATQTALNLKANDNAVVKLTGDQNIRGVKSFLGNQTGSTLKLVVADYFNDGFITSDNGMLRLLNGASELFKLASNGDVTANSFIKSGGTSEQYLKADGSVSTLTNPITGTGTGMTNYIPKFTGANTLGNSLIYDNGTYVGIGTTSPSTLLHLNAGASNDTNLRVQSGAAGNHAKLTFSNSSNTVFWTAGYRSGTGDFGINYGDSFNSTGLTINTSGYVGIGTTSPDARLHVNGALILDNNSLVRNAGNNILNFGADADMYGGSNLDGGLFVYGANKLHLSTNSVRRFTVDGSGYVGIGTTSPDNRLTVSTSNFPAASFYRDLDVLSTGDAGQRILIGARKGSVFTAGASITGVLEGNGDNGNINFETLSSGTLQSRMRITSIGYVGIGTTSPSEKLEVSGNVKATSFIKSGGTSTQYLMADGSVSSAGTALQFVALSVTNGSTATIATLEANCTYMGLVTYLSNKLKYKRIIFTTGYDGTTYDSVLETMDRAIGYFSLSANNNVLSVTNQTGTTQTFKMSLTKIAQI